MKFKNIEVNGIRHIVFNREHKWRFVEKKTSSAISGFDPHPDKDCWFADFEGRTITHNSMMWIVNKLKHNKRYRMWVHLDTLNVVKK